MTIVETIGFWNTVKWAVLAAGMFAGTLFIISGWVFTNERAPVILKNIIVTLSVVAVVAEVWGG